ncbi:hypothetical protein ACP4OV_010051 [Aristida adscensionis]
MYPANQYMDPYYPHYRNHTPYPYYPPGWDAGHPRAFDSSYRPPRYGPWPYSAGMRQTHPPEFHCCCNHMYPPGYYSFKPPFPQELPPPHLYYHGPFPQHPSVHPTYSIPQHPFPVDQAPTPYDYDKFKSHCCGCPNHVCHGGEKSNVKTEEERPHVKPENERKDADNASIIRHPNSQYPFIWFPPGNMEGKENGRRYELPSQLLNGWVPVSSKRADVKQQEQENQKEKQFQWPIVWMPAGFDEPKQKVKELKEIDESPKASEEAPSPKFKIIPLSWFENGHDDQKTGAMGDSGDHSDKSAVTSHPSTTEHRDGTSVEGNHKTSPVVPKRLNNERKLERENYKTIPVLHEKETNGKAGTCRTIPVMTQKESDEKKPGVSEKKEVKKASSAAEGGENGKTNHGESSTAKHSKLPPVCLRVDPLPRKKSGNGSSRSPSPPTRKDADKATKDVEESQNRNMEPKESESKKNITVSEVKEKPPVEMKQGTGFSNETVQAAFVEYSQEEQVPKTKDAQKVQASSTTVNAQENAGAKSSQEVGNQDNAGAGSLQGGDKSNNENDVVIQSEATQDDARTCRTNLSETDAAVRIQSAYRGYDVRRWQPLEKLRKIRNVNEQMQGVSKQLQSLEASSKKPTEKEQVAIGETVMNLLLKLDTIQGLHTSVREARKSVARELICLQEKLDTLCKQPSGGFNRTNTEEKPERAESIPQAVAPALTAEASENEKTKELNQALEPSSTDSTEKHNFDPSGVPMELMHDEDSSEPHQPEEPSTTTRKEAPDEANDAGHFEIQGASSVDMVSGAGLSGHSTDHKQQVEESTAILTEEAPEEENATTQEAQVVPLVDVMGELHDVAAAGDSSGLKQCTTSTEQDLHTEGSGAGVSPAATEDIKTTTATASFVSRPITDKDGSVDGQMPETAPVESPELIYEVSPDGKDKQKELSCPVDRLEDSSVCLKEEEPHEHDLAPADDSVMSNAEDQPEEARDINMKEQVGATQDSTKEPDVRQEVSTDDIDTDATADSEKSFQPPLFEQTYVQNLVLEESDYAMQREPSGEDDSLHVDQQIEPAANKLTDGSASREDPLPEALRMEPDVQDSRPNLEEKTDDSRGETVFPELDSCAISCAHESATTECERPEIKFSAEGQADAQNCSDGLLTDMGASETDECREALKEALVGVMGATSAEEVNVPVSETGRCDEAQKDPLSCTTGAISSEVDPRNLKDVAVQIENKPSEGVFVASATPGGLNDSDEKKLAEENQKLKEMLQKLLASGNEQMGVITDLSEKVKVLERKLARKKRPKVRMHKPARHGTAKVH